MLKFRQLVVLVSCLAVAGSAAAVVAPRDGGKLPPVFFDIKAKDPAAFTMKHGWIAKVQRIKKAREVYLASAKAEDRWLQKTLPAEYAVAGTVEVPVFLCRFTNVAAPFDPVAMQAQLFDFPGNSVTDYYDEISYGNIVLTGTVYDVVALSNADTYYEGSTPGCNGLCGEGRVGQLMIEILDAKDPFIDFGQYDNDGPDGIPNSGDDDGYVDFISIIHPEEGGECGPSTNNNIWSHQGLFEYWPESGDSAYLTDDPATGGDYIRINDYTMQPAKNCGESTIIDIGVFCHEFGHAFGLPDLYDINGTSNGIGHWGIMGSGNWNQPDSPAHPCAWTRAELGWVTPVDVTWQGNTESIEQTAASGDVFRLGFTDDKFRRSTECVIAGSYSLYCGLNQDEGLARGWGTQALNRGYGDNWNETIEREFTYDGTTPVTFSYAYRHDTEALCDYGYAIVDISGTETVLAAYTSAGSGTENHDLTALLSGLTPPATYKLKFRATSDFAWSDQDAGHDSDCGLLVIDDVAVTGGGESYSTGFETCYDGWHQSPAENPEREYWLVENRQIYGYDAHLHGTGLLVMHIDQDVIESTMGNSGDPSNQRVRGVVVEEADGNTNLNSGILNPGDAGDTWPGSANNRTFSVSSWPSSITNSGLDTEVEISGISDSGALMTAFMKAGDPGPVVTLVTPNDINNDQTALDVVIIGDFIKHGATFLFTKSTTAGPPIDRLPADDVDMNGTSIRWVGPLHLEGTINPYSKTGGAWDLIVTNPDGQQYTLNSAININQIVAVQLQSAAINVVGEDISLEYTLCDKEAGETIQLSRSLTPDTHWNVIARNMQPVSDQRYVYLDTEVAPGKTYFYRLEAVRENGEVRELHRGSAAVPAGELTLSQNFPNPFNPTTSIAFYLPERTKLQLDVFDVAGRLVTRLAGGVYEAGPHRVEWNGTNADGAPVGTGIYIYRLVVGNRSFTNKMMLLK